MLISKQKNQVEEWLCNLYSRPQDESGYDQIEELNWDIMRCEDLLRDIETAILLRSDTYGNQPIIPL